MTRYSRRRFIEDSLLAAVAAVLPGCGLPAGETSEKPKKKAPGERLSVAIVGVGGRGAEHIGQFLGNPRTEITYIVDADEKIGQSRLRPIAEKQGRGPKFVRDMRRAFDDKAVDIVSTATPNHWHALCAIWAMQAGKDVYVEKPVSYDVSEGRRIVETARRHNRICQAGMQSRSMQGVRDAIEYVKAGKIGAVKLARGLCYKRRPSIGPKGDYQAPPEVDYDLWTGPAPFLPLTRPKFHYDWHWQRVYGNGDMGNQGPHQMDIGRWGLGIDRLADNVITFGGRLGYEDAGDVANTEIGIFEFGDKTLVFEVRGLETAPLLKAKVGTIFYGSNGYVVIASFSAGTILDPTGKTVQSGGVAFDPQAKVVQVFNGEGDHFGNFVEAVQARDPKLLHADILDSDLETFQIDARKIEAAITDRTALILPVQLGGSVADMDTILAVAGKHKLPVVEDACQSHLAEWRGRKAGTLGTTGCFSFQVSKNLSSGEGGAVLTDDEKLLEKCYAFHNNNGRARMKSGYNFSYGGGRAANLRMTEFQGALLMAQMTRLEAQSKTREQNAQYLTSMLREIPGIMPARMYEGCTRNAYHLYMFRYDPRRFANLSRDKFLAALGAEGIPASGGYSPLNKEGFLKDVLRSRGYRKIYSKAELDRWEERTQCPVNERLCREAVWFTQNMLLGKRRDMDQIADAVRKIHAHAEALAKA